MQKPAAHARTETRHDDGRLFAVSLFDRGSCGVLAWVGRLHQAAENKPVEALNRGDFHARQVVSLMTWHDVEEFFGRFSAGTPYPSLVSGLLASRTRERNAAGRDPA